MRRIRTKVIAILVMMSITLTSCTQREDKLIKDNLSNQVIEEEAPDSLNQKENNQSEQSEVIDNETTFDPRYYTLNENYGIALSTLENNDKPRPEENENWIRSLTINYPQVYNMEDTEKQNRLNDILFKEALNIRDILNDIDYIEYRIDYEIMEANEDVISILFTGHVYDFAHANEIVDTVTIDLNTERFMDLSDYYKVDKSFLGKVKNNEFKPTEDKIRDTDEMNELVAEYVSSYSDEQHLHDFYIKDGTIGLVIPAPQAMNYFIIEGLLDKK